MKALVICLSMLAATSAFAQTQIFSENNYYGWGWLSYVMKNGLITVTTVPEIGARIMEYNLGNHASLYVNPAEIGKTHKPDQKQWFNYGGYKVWPAPQEVWNWPPPAILDAGPWSAAVVSDTPDSAALYVKSQKETWSKTPDISMERRTVIYKNSSRVKVEQSIINEGAALVSWSVWDVSQCIVSHGNERDFENFWVYFPIRKQGSVFGSSGVKTSAPSAAWKGEVAPGVFGVQYKPEGKKIFADSPEGWVAYVDEREGTGYFKLFGVAEGLLYPDGGACVEVWLQNGPYYLEVEVLSPILPLTPQGKITSTEIWAAAKINGPVLTANRIGAVEVHLQFDPSSRGLYGAYGVFYVGTALLRFRDASGAVISEGPSFSVSPLEKLVIESPVAVPPDAATAEIVIFDPDGAEIGVLDTVPAERLSDVSRSAPLDFDLLRCYPNPFNPETALEFSLDAPQAVTLQIYSADGRPAETLVDEFLAEGRHRRVWNAGTFPAGLYFARLSCPSGVRTTKLVLLK